MIIRTTGHPVESGVCPSSPLSPPCSYNGSSVIILFPSTLLKSRAFPRVCTSGRPPPCLCHPVHTVLFVRMSMKPISSHTSEKLVGSLRASTPLPSPANVRRPRTDYSPGLACFSDADLNNFSLLKGRFLNLDLIFLCNVHRTISAVN